jgi:predicted MFS family arabinose efflux permease
MPMAIGTVVLALLGLFAFAKVALVAIVFITVAGVGISLFTVAGSTAVIELKPSDGSAWYSTAYNVGIATGPLTGAITLQQWGLRALPLASVVVGIVGLSLLVGTDLRLRHRHH